MGKCFRKAKNRGKKGLKALKSNAGAKIKSRRMTVTHSNSQDQKHKEMSACYLELRSRRLKKNLLQPRCASAEIMKAQEVEESNCSANCDHVAQNFSPVRAGRSSKLFRLCRDSSREEVSSSTAVKQVAMEGAISRSSSFSALAQASFNACVNQGEASCVGDNSAQVDQDSYSLRKRQFQKTGSVTPCSRSCAEMDDKLDAQDSRRSGGDSDEKTEGEKAAPTSACKRLFGAPSRDELEEFFTDAEQKQGKHLTERYNFDFQKDVPLPGRYEWTCLSQL